MHGSSLVPRNMLACMCVCTVGCGGRGTYACMHMCVYRRMWWTGYICLHACVCVPSDVVDGVHMLACMCVCTIGCGGRGVGDHFICILPTVQIHTHSNAGSHCRTQSCCLNHAGTVYVETMKKNIIGSNKNILYMVI